MFIFPPTLPQLFALLFLASVAALIGELITGAAPYFGFLGAMILAIAGILLITQLPLPQIGSEPLLEDLPVIRGILGGMVLVGLSAYYRKRKSRY